jgi:hypothetical protein
MTLKERNVNCERAEKINTTRKIENYFAKGREKVRFVVARRHRACNRVTSGVARSSARHGKRCDGKVPVQTPSISQAPADDHVERRGVFDVLT